MNGSIRRECLSMTTPSLDFLGRVQICENAEIYGRLENAFDLDYETTSGFEAAGFGAYGGVRIFLGK